MKLKGSKTRQGLSMEQERFCQSYVSYDSETFGNGVKSYLNAYGPSYLVKNKKIMSYSTAQGCAFDNLRKPKIFNRINELLEVGGFNNENVDKQHLFLINQYSDLRTKMSAIDSYNKLKRRLDSKIELILPRPILDVIHNTNNSEESILNTIELQK